MIGLAAVVLFALSQTVPAIEDSSWGSVKKQMTDPEPAGSVRAKAATSTVSCEFDYGGTHIAKQWIDDEGVLHLRDITYGLTCSGSVQMLLAGVCNHNYDLVSGDGDFWGKDHTIEVSWAGLTGVFRGSHSGTRVGHTTGYSTHVYHGIGGDFEGWKLKLNGTWDFASKQGSLEGIIKDPHGE